MALKQKTGTLADLVDELVMKLVPFSKHFVNAKWQVQQFDYLRRNVPDKWAIMCMDFGENNNCHFQEEAESAHWSYNQATIHPVVAYYRCPEESCDLVTHESFMYNVVATTVGAGRS